MFNLLKNNFIDGSYCTYVDEYNNKAYMRRENGFIVARLRFADATVKADTMHIPFPIGETLKGDTMHLTYSDKRVLDKQEIKSGIDNFTQLINYWINLLYDIKLLDAGSDIIRQISDIGTMNEEQVAEYKLSRLRPYGELKGLLGSMS